MKNDRLDGPPVHHTIGSPFSVSPGELAASAIIIFLATFLGLVL